MSLSAPPTRLVLYEDLVAVSGALLAMIILSDKDVTDINDLRITQEGRYYHVDAMIELRRGLSLADADDIKFRVQEKLIMDPDITDVVLGIFEENGVIDWTPEILNEFS